MSAALDDGFVSVYRVPKTTSIRSFSTGIVERVKYASARENRHPVGRWHALSRRGIWLYSRYPRSLYALKDTWFLSGQTTEKICQYEKSQSNLFIERLI